jgi:PH (Pleckstrin Homology) domain-containing protein
VTTIFVDAIGVGLLAPGVALIIHGIMSAGFRAGGLIIVVVGLVLALFLVANALRPAALATDDTGLRLRRTFGSRHIPWEAVRAFRVEPGGRGGPSLQATPRTNEVTWLPTPTSSGATAGGSPTNSPRHCANTPSLLRLLQQRAGPGGE